MRRKTRKINVRGLEIGGDAPISIQSMTKTNIENVAETIHQIEKLVNEGCQLVRIAIPTPNAIKYFEQIRRQTDIPIETDIHFNSDLALSTMKAGADAVRLNPGNISDWDSILPIVKYAINHSVPFRVGMNSGSVFTMHKDKYPTDLKTAMINMANDFCKFLEKQGMKDIMVSLKSSDINETVEVNRHFAKLNDYPMHLGVTAAGNLIPATVRSSLALGQLLQEGIGDTIRISITGDPVQEIKVAKELLLSTGRRENMPKLISCPTCGRCRINLINVVNTVNDKLKDYDKNIFVAVMGCVVNGPGEAKEADVGIAGGDGKAVLFKKGKIVKTIEENDIIDELFEEINSIVGEK